MYLNNLIEADVCLLHLLSIFLTAMNKLTSAVLTALVFAFVASSALVKRWDERVQYVFPNGNGEKACKVWEKNCKVAKSPSAGEYLPMWSREEVPSNYFAC